VAGGRAEITDDERRRILEMVERHTITAAAAAELIHALAGRPAAGSESVPSPPPRLPSLRVRVTDLRTGRVRTDVTIPAPGLGLARGLARRLRVPGPGVIDEVAAALRSERHGLVASCANGHGARVEFFLQ